MRMTQEQVLSAADPSVAMASLKDDEALLLRKIMTVLCLDPYCADLFQRIVFEGASGISEHSHYGPDHYVAVERLRRVRDGIIAASEGLRDLVMEETK